jgi:cathepsin L
MRKISTLSIIAATVVGTLYLLNIQLPQNNSNFLQQFDSIDGRFTTYLAQHSKSYRTKEEYLLRRQLFESSLAFVEAHNARPEVTSRVAINMFADMTREEIRERYFGDSGQPEIIDNQYEYKIEITPPNADPVPIDWRDYGIIGPVKNQASCGSCWSFSTVGPIEEHYKKKYNQSVVLSEQQLVDCSWPYGNNGCQGGLYANGYAYVKQFGLMANASYPYTAKDGNCSYDADQVIVRITGTLAAIRTFDGLKQALMNGPASISLHADFEPFLKYSGGIFDYPDCPTTVDHAVQAVGWGRATNSTTGVTKDYFIVRNSWGATWGENGYIRIAQTNTTLGNCGMLYRAPMQPLIA